MDQKKLFVLREQTWEKGFAELCRLFRISRTTGYKWKKRYAERGEAGLEEVSRRPKYSPYQTPADVEQEVIAVRLAHPYWGGRKIRHVLLRAGCPVVPSASTITTIVRRHGLMNEDDRHPHTYRRFEQEVANKVWQIDHKGHFPMTQGGRCHPLTITDDHSRYCIALNAYPGEEYATVKAGLTEAFRTYGMPAFIQCDNGVPWGSVSADGKQSLTRIEVWLIRLGIRIYHIRPYHPQTNGKVERLHRTLKLEVLSNRVFADLADCQRAFDKWRKEYNEERPHEALGYSVPATRYQPSARRFPETLPAVEYDTDYEPRKVNSDGKISVRRDYYRVGKSLAGQYVGLRKTTVDGTYVVYYCHQKIREITLRKEGSL